MRNKLIVLLMGLGLIVGLGTANASPAHAATSGTAVSVNAIHPQAPVIAFLTNRYIVSGDGDNNLLNVAAYVQGANYSFSTGNSCTVETFELKHSGSPGEYYIHPCFYNSTQYNWCMTFSTTQFGLVKDEPCVDASNQLFYDLAEGGGDYTIYNVGLGEFLNDPHTSSGSNHIAGWVKTCSIGHNGCNFQQF